MRVCFVLRVKPERMDEYRQRHRDVWPSMRRALSEAGWHNYSLFLRQDGLLVGYLECEDFEAAKEAMARTEVNRLWQAEMAEFFADTDGADPDQAMIGLEEVFHLD
ncbi:L-rhamnose mutarotase [Actinopolyspora xinjiangensis]|uniref:L-rhamnose mutarotase n=1 Tax=Actinopolyspora xinjiangensis TaxID=405564 RepID=A0A1H0RYU5_9ACTN|nr:L-rhamnose mutarotase [Actinopolyspora xinjiangensis]SDP34108.1 L-rhamnose mutarotase [Actinopolyspora xinjiangensis]